VKPRYLGDVNLRQAIVRAVLRQEPGVDFRTAADAGLHGLDDLDVLAFAAQDRRILVTHDVRTMPGHFSKFLQASQSPGVFLVPQTLSNAAAAEELVLIWSATDAEEWLDRLVYLPL
jgi:hypothetical protein